MLTLNGYEMLQSRIVAYPKARSVSRTAYSVECNYNINYVCPTCQLSTLLLACQLCYLHVNSVTELLTWVFVL